MIDSSSLPVQTRRMLMAHLTLCRGCCCGQAAKGRPDVPVDWMKEEWKKRGLKKSIQLTISGCLGPCDIANVASISSAGRTEWMGSLHDFADYEALLEWATRSRDASRVLPLPGRLQALRFDPFRRQDALPVLVATDASQSTITS